MPARVSNFRESGIGNFNFAGGHKKIKEKVMKRKTWEMPGVKAGSRRAAAVTLTVLLAAVCGGCGNQYSVEDAVGGIFATTALAAASIVDNIFLLGMVPFLIWYGFTTASNFVGRKSGITVDLIWLLDMSHGAILHKETVFVTGAVVGVITAIIYFVNGVKQDAL